MRYIDRHRPLVIVGGPPCTSFSKLSKMNRCKFPSQWRASRVIGERLAQVMADACERQHREKRFFLVEQPANSEMWELGCFKKLWSRGNMASVTFPQCAVGLKSPEGIPLLKWTDLWSNSMEILQQFDDLHCRCDVHGTIIGGIGGQRRSKVAQVWPLEMCRRIVEGICM